VEQVDELGGHGRLLDEIAAVTGAVCEQLLTRPHHDRMQQQPKLVEPIVGLIGGSRTGLGQVREQVGQP
jgi:hypothetical protein